MIHHGDLFDVLPTLVESSVDACVTDPPYGLGFMAKEWDVPGGIGPFPMRRRVETDAVNTGASRQGGRQRSCADFQKRQRRDAQAFEAEAERWAIEVFRVLEPGGHLVAFGGTRMFHRMASGIEDAGFEIRDCLSWLYGQGFPKSLNLGDGRGTALKPSWEPIILARKPLRGTVAANVAQFGTGALNIDACRIDGDKRKPGYREPGTPHEKRGSAWDDGSGFKCKPFGDDLGRWPANVVLDPEAAAMLDEQSGERPSAGEYKDPYPKNARVIHAATFADGWKQFTGGYWAKIVTPDETFPVRPDGSLCEPVRHRDRAPRTGFDNGANRNNYYANDSGGASRFYYVAKPSREERDYGCDSLPTRQRDESRKEGNPGGDNPRNRGLQPRGNFHPTVKPVELMRWLVKLVTPPDGIVLDPFMGSGTTGMACRYEHRQFIGIEREAEYVAIAERRIAAVAPLFGEASA